MTELTLGAARRLWECEQVWALLRLKDFSRFGVLAPSGSGGMEG
jgi:hypothetical protein